MKNVIYWIVLNCISLNLNAQEIIPNLVTKITTKEGKDLYILNNTKIKDFDFSRFNLNGRESFFTYLVGSLPFLDNYPIDVVGIFNKVKNYQSIPYQTAKTMLSYSQQTEEDKTYNWMPSDSINSYHGNYHYNGIDFGGFIESHQYRIIIINQTYATYTITSFNHDVFINTYTKSGELISSSCVLSSEGSYFERIDDIRDLFLRTIIDKDKKLHQVFIGGAATCNKYTMMLDSTGRFVNVKIQNYDCSYLPAKYLSDYTMSEIINLNQGEILKAYISDPDGYTNVREQPEGSSPILYKINKDDTFYIIIDLVNTNWYKVALYQTKSKSGKIEKSYEEGYIHKSRVKIVPKD